MNIYSTLKQYYRYLRNLKKLHSKDSKLRKSENFKKQINFYSRFIRPGDLCFDVGANIGDKTAVFLELGAKVVAVEPQKSCWRILKHRFNNGDVFIEPCVLSDTKGTKDLFVDRSTTLSSISHEWIQAVKKSGRFSNRHKWDYKIPVQATTLDALIEKYGKPVFCKIDVEGAELDVLKGLSKPIKFISFEFVSERINDAISCIDYLSKLDRAGFNYHLGEAVSFASPNWLDPEQIKTILKIMECKPENFGDIYARFIAVSDI